MRFLLGYGSCGIASGAKNVLKGLENAFENTPFTVERVGCNGLCFAEPIVEVITDDGESILYGRLTEESAIALGESAKNGSLMT
ncbi:MAG: (2Fe-2S) ferredoxin domain-containing protein, partial [Acutalibacteraceae bacterium]|nr:(2Fe-2S) ferredoxin domain-containing protein [Acutalibacteraceae bacterium]